MWVGIIQYIEALHRTKRWRKVEFFVSLGGWRGTLIFSCPWHTWFSGLQTRVKRYTIPSIALRLSNSTTGYPGSSTCREHIVGLQSPPSCEQIPCNKSLCTHLYSSHLLLVLVLWRTLLGPLSSGQQNASGMGKAASACFLQGKYLPWTISHAPSCSHVAQAKTWLLPCRGG